LTDTHVLEQIVRVLAPRKGDKLLEIGPGHGALTEYLAGTTERYVAIEIDRDLIDGLRARFTNVDVISADVLKVDFAGIWNAGRWRVVGNLPYNITTPLMIRLLAEKAHIEDMHFMLQKELAERLAAVPSTKAWGRLTVLMQYHCSIETLFEVAPESFSPPPKVFSSVVRILPRTETLPLDDPGRLDRVLRLAFSARRKRLSNALKDLGLPWDDLDVDANARPDQLSVEEFVTLANAMEE
jgi:16S rRNA (adenine1518-N6/adenine1519-N6)-dimethyltransferase